ncbi:MAG: diguanylate cyclase [Ardenticatenia bacterium]|nr:diguanylate cyclase [Ardenticatenia bacterium]
MALERHNRLLSRLNDVIRTAMEATSLDDLLPRLARQFRQAFSARACYLVLWDEPDGRGELAITAVACSGDGPVWDTPANVGSTPLFRRLLAACRASSEPFCQMPDEGHEEATTWAVIPLRDEEQERVVGGAFLLLRGEEIPEDRKLLAVQFARQVTLAMNRVRLYDRLHDQNRRLNALYAVSTAVVTLNPTEVLGRALDVIVDHLEWDAGWIVMPAGEGRLDELPKVVVSRNASPPLLEVATRYPIRDCRACALLYRRHDTDLLLQVDECLHLRRDVLVRCGFHDVVGVPVRGSQDTLGILFLVRRRREHQRYREPRRDILSIGHHVGMALENARLHQAVREEIVRDPLTGIYNRRFLKEHLQWLFSVSQRVGREISLIMVDLDYFKQFNDRYGHLEGDNVLRTVAQLIEQNVRSSDVVARYGGEEFTIVLPETGRQEAALVAERVRRAVAEHPFRHYLFANAQRITVSLGVATAPEDATSPEQLIEAADQALYQAKANGKNRVVVYRKVKVS